MISTRRGPLAALVVLVTLPAWAFEAQAAGYDTPILYSARHMGMGGTAIAYVDDPSAIFHNPAGLGRIGTASLLADISLLVGNINAAPSVDGETVESDLAVSPAFLVGGAYRITDWLVAGFSVYPVAAAGASYEYEVGSDTIIDQTTLRFFEFSPAVAVTLPYGFHLGFGYRISLVQFERVKGVPDDPGLFNIEMSGLNFEGFRLGLQWQPVPEIGVGFTYRFKTRNEVEADSGKLITDVNKTKTEFILPSQVGVGIRGDYANVGVSFDLQYTFNSQVQQQQFIGELPVTDATTSLPAPLVVDNVAAWRDNFTLRLGAEYKFDVSCLGWGDHIAARIGYVYDGQVGNKAYPSAFGTPPIATQTGTAGVGFDAGPWEVNLAYAYRFGATHITPEDKGPLTCLACSKSGYYDITLHGVYVDFSYDFE